MEKNLGKREQCAKDSTQAKGEISWDLAVNKAIAELAGALLNPSFSIEEIADIILEQAKNLTESEHGYVSSIDPDTGDAITHTLTKMMGKQCRVSRDKQKIIFPVGADGLYPLLWGYSLNTRATFYTNSPEKHEAWRGIPKGHIRIRNFLSVPALVGTEVVGQIALANSAGGYTAHHAEAISHIGKLYAVALQRKRGEKALRESEERFRTLFEQAAVGVAQIETKTGRFLRINQKYCDIVGYSVEELRSRSVQEIIHPDDLQADLDSMEKLIKGDITDFAMEKRYSHKKGKIVWVNITVSRMWGAGQEPNYHIAVIEDVTERKNEEQRRRLAGQILGCLNRETTGLEVIRDVLGLIKESMGFAAVGIRLNEGNDFPYFETNGFSKDFLKTENYLCAQDKDGHPIYDKQGNTLLECMCGNVLSGRTNPALSFFTERGSFWTNCTTKLLASTSTEDLQGPTRNRCNQEGYESVAIIPLRSGNEIVGLLQLNDPKEGRFSIEMIRFFEEIGNSIGMGLARIQAEQDLENIAKFPWEDPNPVLRISQDGTLLYANPAAYPIIQAWNCRTGRAVPDLWHKTTTEVLSSDRNKRIEDRYDDKIFSFLVVPFAESGYANLYGRDITKRKAAEEDLRKHREHLKELVETRTTELREANKQLMAEIEGRKELEREILDISERERRRLGDELHDSLGQQLTGIAFMTKVLERKLAETSPNEVVDVVEIAKLVEQATNQARALARGLHPLDLGADSLMSSLEELAGQTRERIGVLCSFKCDEAVKVDDVGVAVHLYRIAQEAVTNAIKHGKAKNIEMALVCNEDTSVMTIRNDGLDFPKEFEARSTGMGLQIMDHRVDLIGGSLDVRAGDEGGTILTCTFPNKNRG
jgi:PAS domain S-box-containing protein